MSTTEQQPWYDNGVTQVGVHHVVRRTTQVAQGAILNLARKEPDVFVNFVMAYNAPASGPNKWYPPALVGPHGGGLTCPMHYAWQQTITQNPRVYIEAPREHSKTTRVSIGRIIWELGVNPDQRIKVVCQNDDKASELVVAVSQHILNNPRVQQVFPNLMPDAFSQWARHKIVVKRSIISRDASLEASGILAAGVGGRADILILDDPVDYKNAIQFPALREQVKRSFYSVWVNLLPAYGGRIVYICTPWHMLDLSMDIKTNHPEYALCSHPIDDALTPVWPTKWDKEALLDRMRDIGSREFDRGFRLRPLSDEDALFKESQFLPHYRYNFSLGQTPDGTTSGWHFYTGVDLGVGKGSATRTSIFTFGVKKQYGQVPVEIKIGRMGEVEKVKQVYATWQKWQPELIVVENNSYQETFLTWLKDLGLKMPVRGAYTGSQKADLTIGLPSLAVEVENAMWLIPRAGHSKDTPTADPFAGARTRDKCTCPVCQWLNECFSYPLGNSDVLMSWWIAREGYRNLAGRLGPRLRFISTQVRRSTGPKFYRGDTDDDDDEE